MAANQGPGERDVFLNNGHGSGRKDKDSGSGGLAGCCRSKHTSRCCIATVVFGAVFIVFGVVALTLGRSMLEKKILKSMALTPGSDRTESWLNPPVQPHLTAYAFHITNPNAVLAGKKPILEERGPFVYKAVTIKDSDNNMQWNEEEGLLTYRARKVYSFVPELSAEGFKDPDNIFVTVPNIPFWTGLNKVRKESGFKKSMGLGIVTSNGGVAPFVNVSINGLLWGYPGSDLPCLTLNLPEECAKARGMAPSPFAASNDDDDDWGNDNWGNDDSDSPASKTETGNQEKSAKEQKPDIAVPDFVIPSDSIWEPMVKPKAEYIDCKCEFGLFRDRNVTMRQPVTFYTGTTDLKMKGFVHKYDGKSTLGWWKPESSCDAVKGQDAGTLYPGIETEDELEIFIDLMCRTIKLKYEKDMEHAGIRTYRFIPPENAMGSHNDPDPNKKNPDNECYCLDNEGFTCFKSGVLNMAPCKRENNAPLALSLPHFYQADQSFLDAVSGLNPEKEKHQFFIDVVPEFGFPLAIRPRFQLNLVLFRIKELPELANMVEEIVMPFMWAEDGFGEPSTKMADAIRYGLAAPEKFPMLAAVACFALGGLLILVALIYFVWQKRSSTVSKNIS